MRKIIVSFLQRAQPHTLFSISTLRPLSLAPYLRYSPTVLSRTYAFSTTKSIRPELVTCHKLQTYIQCPLTIENLNKKGIEQLFPVQANTYQDIYEGKDLIASDRTGSGKTMAFTLPVIERMRKNGVFNKIGYKGINFLIMAPTRELALQISSEINHFNHYRNQIKVATLIGGADMSKQRMELRGKPHIIVATPGRLMDFYNRGDVHFKDIEVVCIDEADLMLEKGFKDDIEFILERTHSQAQKFPQHLLFSATMPKWVIDITQRYMNENKRQLNLLNEEETQTSKTVKHICMEVQPHEKIKAIEGLIQQYGKNGSVLIFTGKKVEADFLSQDLKIKNFVLHGDISQNTRTARIRDYRAGKTKVMIATDVASRGLDIPNVELVIQFEPPENIDSYIHRSGRTGRAGRTGTCITLLNPFTQSDKQRMSKILTTSKIDLQLWKIYEDKSDNSLVMQQLEKDFSSYFRTNMKDLGKMSSKKTSNKYEYYDNQLKIQLQTVFTKIDLQKLKEDIEDICGSLPKRVNTTITKRNTYLIFLEFNSPQQCQKTVNKTIQIRGKVGLKQETAVGKTKFVAIITK